METRQAARRTAQDTAATAPLSASAAATPTSVSSTPDSVIAFSFGVRDEPKDPNRSNAELATAVKLEYGHLPVFAQHEIASLLPEDQVTCAIEHRSDRYLDTHDVAVEAVHELFKRGLHHPVVVAHPAHLRRALAVCARLGIEPLAPNPPLRIDFDPSSKQWWTRSHFRWLLRELPTSVIYRILRWT